MVSSSVLKFVINKTDFSELATNCERVNIFIYLCCKRKINIK